MATLLVVYVQCKLTVFCWFVD